MMAKLTDATMITSVGLVAGTLLPARRHTPSRATAPCLHAAMRQGIGKCSRPASQGLAPSEPVGTQARGWRQPGGQQGKRLHPRNQYLGKKTLWIFSCIFQRIFSGIFQRMFICSIACSNILSLSQWVFTGIVQWTFSCMFQWVFMFASSGFQYVALNQLFVMPMRTYCTTRRRGSRAPLFKVCELCSESGVASNTASPHTEDPDFRALTPADP